MCARLYPNGDGQGKGTHLSLFFVIMRGHYDNIIKWPFRQKVSMFLVKTVHNTYLCPYKDCRSELHLNMVCAKLAYSKQRRQKGVIRVTSPTPIPTPGTPTQKHKDME